MLWRFVNQYCKYLGSDGRRGLGIKLGDVSEGQRSALPGTSSTASTPLHLTKTSGGYEDVKNSKSPNATRRKYG